MSSNSSSQSNRTLVKHYKKRVCECSEEYITYHVSPAGCSSDAAAVAALPDKWVPRHSGPLLAEYLKKREQDHNDVLQDIACKTKAVNDEIDSKIRMLAEALLAHIQHNNNEIDCTIERYGKGEDALGTEERDEALKEIYKLHAKRVDEMTHFSREATLLERERADGLRILMRDQFQRLINVGHVPPKDLLHEFDDRVYQTNQQLLSNNRAFIELETQLRVQAEERMVRARSAINQLCLIRNTRNRAQSAMTYTSEDRVPSLRISSAVAVKQSDGSFYPIVPAPTPVVEIEGLEECVLRLVHAYKSSVSRVYTGFSDRLTDLEKDLAAHYFITNLYNHKCQALEFHQMIDRTVGRLSTCIHKKHIASRLLVDATADDMLSMQKSVWSMGESLQDTFNVLHDAGHLWDGHVFRQALAQKLTIAAVEDLLTNNDALQMANEVVFNVTLERLRGMPDPDKLQAEFAQATGILERTAELYRLHSEAELARLQEYMKLTTFLADALLSEIQCFLEKHPRFPQPSLQMSGSGTNPEYMSSSSRKASDSLQSPVPRVILETELQQLALSNWRNGFLESFESNISQVPEELRRQAQLWVEERASALHMRFSLKMVSHSVRVERLKAARDLRLSELNHHDNRINSHLDALYELIYDLPRNASQFPPADYPQLYPLKERISQIQDNINALVEAKEQADPETKRLKMASYAPRLSNHRKCYEESINRAIELYKRMVEHEIQNARIAGVRYMSHVSLFIDGGTYCAQEALRVCLALVKGGDALETCINSVTEALNMRRNQLMAEADLLLNPLLKICDDVVGKKGAKGKPQSPKKK